MKRRPALLPAKGIVQQTMRLLKKELPELLVLTDVCLCEYMSHGHCGIVDRKHEAEWSMTRRWRCWRARR